MCGENKYTYKKSIDVMVKNVNMKRNAMQTH